MGKIVGKNITLTFPKASHPALKEVAFTIESGKIAVFLGVSGSGKTTLLKCMAGILNHHEGSITYEGISKNELTKRERITEVGFVSQHYQLFPHMTVFHNCCHPQIKVLGKLRIEAEKSTEKLLDQLDLFHLKERYPEELSGGQQQRVAIARALAMGSLTLLLDEPTSALDPESTHKLKTTLLQLKKEGYTIVITTHDIAFAQEVRDDVFFMQDGMLIESFRNKSLSKSSKTYQFLNHFQEKE